MDAVVAQALPNAMFEVELENGHKLIAYAAGRTDSWKRTRRAGSGAPRDTRTARTPKMMANPMRAIVKGRMLSS